NELQELSESDVVRTKVWREALETLVLLMAPSTPYVAEELWELLGKPYSVHEQTWPEFSADLAREETLELVLQVNGKLRDKVSVPADLSEARARELAFASCRVMEYLGDKEPSRVIYVPGKLINIVV
nr:class I tRNA ligase family protein [Chloroflexota bacterium]